MATWISMREACEMLRVSRRTVQRLIEYGHLKAQKDNDKPHAGNLEIALESITDYLKKCSLGAMEHDTFPRLWTLQEVHERTGFALRTLERDCRAGKIAHVHRGRHRFMTAAQVEDLVAGHTVKPKGAPPDAEKLRAQEQLRRMMARAKKS